MRSVRFQEMNPKPISCTGVKNGIQILYCSLCGKNYNDVNKLITADGVTLCDVCYVFCAEQEDCTGTPKNMESSENSKQKQIAGGGYEQG